MTTAVPVSAFVGGAIQSVALGIVERGDANTSFVTRSVGTVTVTLLLVAGSIIAAAGAPSAPVALVAALAVPTVRGDLVLLLLSSILHMVFWAGQLRPNGVLYSSDVYPLQVAAMIWNNCAPVRPPNRGEDGGTVLVDMLRDQRLLWRATSVDSLFVRSLKVPVYVGICILCAAAEALEAVLFWGWRTVVDRTAGNVTLVDVQGQRQLVLGHTALIADAQLSWLREATMRGGNAAADRVARRVLVRAVHVANLLVHSGHTRLHEHSPHGHAMSEYFQRVANSTLKQALATSQIDELRVLQALPNGNSLTRGQLIPKQVMWARLVAGCSLSLDGSLRWRGPVASAVLVVAQENVEQWAANVSRTAIHRHVYSVMRRWLVDWVMYIWWDLDIPDGAVDDGAAFFGRLRALLLGSLVNNTQSLPHAVGELLVSAPKTDDVVTILAGTLGGGWELWASTAVTASGVPLEAAMEGSGEWLCAGRVVGEDVAVDHRLYVPAPLERVLQTPATAPQGEQARAVLANRMIDTLVARVQAAWEAQPVHLVDALETVAENDIM